MNKMKDPMKDQINVHLEAHSVSNNRSNKG